MRLPACSCRPWWERSSPWLATGLPVALHHRDPDVVNLGAGLVLLVAGAQLVVWESTRPTAIRCLVLASVAWFAPDLAGDVAVFGPVLGVATLAHVPLLVAAVVLAPEGRCVARDRPVLALALVAAASAETDGYQVLVPATGLALLAAGIATWRSLPRRTSRPALAYLCAVVAVVAALTGVPVARDSRSTAPLSLRFFAAYAGLLAVAAVALVAVGPWLRRSAALDVGADALAKLSTGCSRT